MVHRAFGHALRQRADEVRNVLPHSGAGLILELTGLRVIEGFHVVLSEVHALRENVVITFVRELVLDRNHAFGLRIKAEFVRHLIASVDALTRLGTPRIGKELIRSDVSDNVRRQTGGAFEVDEGFNLHADARGKRGRRNERNSAVIGVDRAGNGIGRAVHISGAGQRRSAGRAIGVLLDAREAVHINERAIAEKLDAISFLIALVAGRHLRRDLAFHLALRIGVSSMDASRGHIRIAGVDAVHDAVFGIETRFGTGAVRQNREASFARADIGGQIVRKRDGFGDRGNNRHDSAVRLKREVFGVNRRRNGGRVELAAVGGRRIGVMESLLHHVSRNVAAISLFIRINGTHNAVENDLLASGLFSVVAGNRFKSLSKALRDLAVSLALDIAFHKIESDGRVEDGSILGVFLETLNKRVHFLSRTHIVGSRHKGSSF